MLMVNDQHMVFDLWEECGLVWEKMCGDYLKFTKCQFQACALECSGVEGRHFVLAESIVNRSLYESQQEI